MMDLELLLALCACGVAPILGVPMVRRRNQRRWRDELVAYELRFPRGLDPVAVSAFLSGLSGVVAHRLVRPFVVRAVMFEVSATAAGIRHHCWCQSHCRRWRCRRCGLPCRAWAHTQTTTTEATRRCWQLS